jgi:hypothetical protein
VSDDPLDVDTAVAELYREPPESFVAGRDALAKTLRAAKRRDEATTVGKLRRPSRVAWAFNAALAGDADLGARLDDAVAAVTDAQEGTGSVRSANAALREVVDDLVEAAARTSADAGHDLDRSTLTPSALAVVGDSGALAELQAGRLGDVPSGGGFGFGLELPAEPAERPARPRRAAGTAAGTAAAKEQEATGRTAKTAGRAKAKAKAKAEPEAAAARPAAEAKVTARVAAARRAVADAEGEEAAAGEAVGEAEAALAASREQVDAAEAERAEAEQAVAEAQERLARSKRDLAEANRHHREAGKTLSKAWAHQEKAEAAAAAARATLAGLDG